MKTETTKEDTAPPKNFFLRLYQGNVSLPITFWVFGFLVGYSLNIIVKMLSLYVKNDLSILESFIYLFMAFQFIYSIFIMIGIWRSAGNYKRRKIWKILARLSIVLWIILNAIALFGFIVA